MSVKPLNNQVYFSGGPVDGRTVVATEANITSISNAYVGMGVTVLNNGSPKKYTIKKLTILGKPDTKANGGYEEDIDTIGAASKESVNIIADKLNKLPSGMYYGQYSSVENLPAIGTLEQKGYAYVASVEPNVYYIYLYNADGEEWQDSGNKFVTTELETNLSTKSQTKAPTTKAVKEGIEAIDITLARSVEDENELTKAQKYNASANINDRTAVVVSDVIESLGYKVLNPLVSFAAQVTEPNTVYEIRDFFEISDETNVISTDTIINYPYGDKTFAYYLSSNTITLEPQQGLRLPHQMYLFSEDNTIIYPNFYINRTNENVTLYVGSILQSSDIPYTLFNVVKIPNNCTLKFNGGCIQGGVLDLNGALLDGENILITSEPAWDKADESFESYKPLNKELNVEWFGAKGDGITDDAPALQRSIKWLHKNGATLIFGQGKSYLLGDGIANIENDPFKDCHTGYNYDGVKIWDGTLSYASGLSYIKEHPVNIGRRIVLTFFKYKGLSILGNNSKLIQNPLNGICTNNRTLELVACDNVCIENLTILGNGTLRTNNNNSFINTDGPLYQAGYFLSNRSSTEGYSSYWRLYMRSRGLWAGQAFGPMMYCHSFVFLMEVTMIQCVGCRLTNVDVTDSKMTPIAIIGGSDLRFDTNNVIENCKFLYSQYHGSFIQGGFGITFRSCEFGYAGIDLNGNTTNAWNTSDTIDLESDYRDPNFRIEFITYENCYFHPSKPDRNRVILNCDTNNILFNRCYFKDTELRTIENVGAYHNEIAYCTFDESNLDLHQEMLHVHHNYIKKTMPATGVSSLISNITKTAPNYDYTHGFLYTYSVTLSDLSETELSDRKFIFLKWEDGRTNNTIYADYADTPQAIIKETTDGINTEYTTTNNVLIIDDVIVAVVNSSQGVSGDIASVVPSQVEYNFWKFIFPENSTATYVTKLIDNICFNNNTIVNHRVSVTPEITCTEFIGNNFFFEPKYSSSKGYAAMQLRPFFKNKRAVLNVSNYQGRSGYLTYEHDGNTYVRGSVYSMPDSKQYIGIKYGQYYGQYDSIIIHIRGQKGEGWCEHTFAQVAGGAVYSKSPNSTFNFKSSNTYLVVEFANESSIRYYFEIIGISMNNYALFIEYATSTTTFGTLTNATQIETTTSLSTSDKKILNNSLQSPIFHAGREEVEIYDPNSNKMLNFKGLSAGNQRGASNLRPTGLTATDAGYDYYDTDLGKPIYWNGSAWVDGNGNLLTEIQVSDKSVLLQASASSNTVEVYTSDTPTIAVKNPDDTTATWLSAEPSGTTLTISATANTIIVAPEWALDTYYSESGGEYTLLTSKPANWDTNYADYYTEEDGVHHSVEGVVAPASNPRGGKVVLTNTTDEVVINVIQNYV